MLQVIFRKTVDIKIDKQGEVSIVTLRGKLDATTAQEFEAALDKLIGKNEVRILVDMAELEYISSAGLRVLLTAAKNLKKRAGIITVASLNEHVGQVFEISGFSTIFPIYASAAVGLQTMMAVK